MNAIVARVAAAVVVAVLTVLGVWLTGGVLTDDATLAMVLTGAWFAVAGVLAVAVALRWRRMAWAVVGSWLGTALVVGGFLFLTSNVDRAVDEDVVQAGPLAGSPAPTASPTPTPSPTASAAPSASAPAPSASPTAAPPAADRATLSASGAFRAQAHETRGLASLIRLPSGRRVLTLTRFATSPGPDLRVYLVPPQGDIGDAVDLGALKGNKGDQQYAVPRRADAGKVVVWCRAFTVAFGTARLRPAG